VSLHIDKQKISNVHGKMECTFLVSKKWLLLEVTNYVSIYFISENHITQHLSVIVDKVVTEISSGRR
jgi:hypothetical protein